MTSCISTNGSSDKTSSYIKNKNSYRTGQTVESVQRSFVWTSCDSLADEVILDLKLKANSIGGDSISNILFDKDGNFISNTPICERQLGWFIFYILPGLGPWVHVASAKADVIRFGNNPEESNETNKKVQSNCAPLVSGSKEKLVCGDSKDRVLEKWGNPSSASPSLGQWRYENCVIEFLHGKLNNYGGQCDFTQISNDSFIGKRIEISQNANQLKHQNCLKVDVGETLQTTLALMGNPKNMSRNDVTLNENKCLENFGHPSFFLPCSDTVLTYLFNTEQHKTECKLYFKNKKLFYIDKECPISCTLFE